MDKLLIPYRKSSLWGYCSPDKTIIIPCAYEWAGAFRGDAAIVMRKGKYGGINREGKLFIPCRYTSLAEAVQEIYEDDDDELPLALGDSDDSLCLMSPPEEGEMGTYAGVEFRFSGGKYRALEETVSTESYDALGDFREGLIRVRKNKKWGAIDPSGKEIIPCMYDEMEPFDEDYPEYTLVLLNGQWGVIDQNTMSFS
jgi:hypothetical protein